MEVILLENYTCFIKILETAKSTKTKKAYSFVVHFIELDVENPKNIAIPSIHTYERYEDAIQDAYGVIELYGFRFNEEVQKAEIEILNWDNKKKEYVSSYVLYDGYDFFPFEKENNDAKSS